MSWQECLDEFRAVKITPNNEKAKSLLKAAEARINYTEKQEINEESANFILEDYYSSTVEILHSILTKKGFKVEGHICLGFYLKDVLKKEDLFRVFNINRKRRNGIVYYGELVEFNIAKKAIEDLKLLIKELKTYSIKT